MRTRLRASLATPAALLLIPLLLWACSDRSVLEPEPEVTSISAAKPDWAGNGGGGGGGDDEGGDDDGGATTYPVIQGTLLAGSFVGDVVPYDASGDWVTGRDEECGFVYAFGTGTKTCIAIESADRVYPTGINPSGLVAGTAYDAVTGAAIPFVTPAAQADHAGAAVLLEAPSGWDDVLVSHWRPINADGVVAGYLKRWYPKPKKYTWEGALIVWNPDGSIRAVSATAAVLAVRAGLSDEQSDGALRIGGSSDALGGSVVWDGADGSVPTTLDDSGFRNAAISVVSPDGSLYGLSGGAIIEWPTPSSAPSLVTDMGTSLLYIDRNGNFLSHGSDGYFCIRRDDVAAVSQLSPLEGHDRIVARAGDGGLVFGRSIDSSNNYSPTIWNLTQHDGC